MATDKKVSTISEAPASQPSDEAAPFFTPQRVKLFGIAGGVVLLAGVVVWFVITAGKRKETMAAQALEEARGIAQQGNIASAVQKYSAVASNYSGTGAAYEATLGIAQGRLIDGQNELAITTLMSFLKTNPPATYSSPAEGLLGTAYENTGKYAEAEAAYRKESDLATVDYLKATSLLDAGRAARMAKKNDEAIAIYREILQKYGTTASKTEAEVRLGELTNGAG